MLKGFIDLSGETSPVASYVWAYKVSSYISLKFLSILFMCSTFHVYGSESESTVIKMITLRWRIDSL